MSKYKYIITKISRSGSDMIIIEAGDRSGGPVFDYKPGQYAMISYRDQEGKIPDQHAFSLASSPTDRFFIRFGIKMHGSFTKGLANLKIGDELFVDAPHGEFVYDKDRYSNLVMIAGGIGITPFISILRYVASLPIKNRVSLIYAARKESEAAFVEEIKNISSKKKNMSVMYSFSDEKKNPGDSNVIYRRVGLEDINNFCGPVTGKTFFICGPVPFMNAMKDNLISLGAEPEQIKSEAFIMIPDQNVWSRIKNTVAAMSFALGVFIVAFSFLNKGISGIQAETAPVSVQNIASEPISDVAGTSSVPNSVIPAATEAVAPATTVIPSPVSNRRMRMNAPMPRTHMS